MLDRTSSVTAAPTIYPMGSAGGTAALVTGTANYVGTAVSLTGVHAAAVSFTVGNGSGTGAYTLAVEESSTSGTSGFGTASSVAWSRTAAIGTASDEVAVVGTYSGTASFLRAAVQVSGTPNFPISASVVRFPTGPV